VVTQPPPSHRSGFAISNVPVSSRRTALPVHDYDLSATLNSGQAFRWQLRDGTWHGVIGRHAVQLHLIGGVLQAETIETVTDWEWLKDYLQIDLDLSEILSTFPSDEPMRRAVNACRGLRLLRQDPWECLASFILSSTKQIVQIRQIVAALCEQFGDPISTLPDHASVRAFPQPGRLARCSETELRACKMGFRAPYLLATAQRIADGSLDLERLRFLPMKTAREEFMQLPGVGRKIADCVLLFAYGFPGAFPVDVWVQKAIQRLYFPGRRVKVKRALAFSETYFGPNAGYAQQYLFHYMRMKQSDRTD
jgi:N-glycosylase/DNA lyase